MRRPIFKEGTQRAQAYTYRPADPVWASPSLLAEVRARVSSFDPLVAVWWAGSRERWRLMEWFDKSNIWSEVCTWNGDNGEYRPPNASGMIAALERRRIDLGVLARQVEEHGSRIPKSRMAEFRAANREHSRDFRERMRGEKIVTGAGYIRPRRFGFKENKSEHRDFQCRHLIEAWELRNGRRWEGT